jgi:hypothetical protein
MKQGPDFLALGNNARTADILMKFLLERKNK